MAKKDSMQKQVEKDEKGVPTGQQMDLIDVGPENSKEIIQHARLYKAAQTKRIQALDEEIAEKQKLLELIRNAKLKPLEGGKVQFRCDGYIITVTPRDELVRIKESDAETA